MQQVWWSATGAIEKSTYNRCITVQQVQEELNQPRGSKLSLIQWM